VSGKREDDLTAKRREWSRMGGKMSLRTMTPWERKVRAHKAGLAGGAPRRIDHERVLALRAAGKKYREIAAGLGISMPSVARILAKGQKRPKRN
jgi:hypothetical protein